MKEKVLLFLICFSVVHISYAQNRWFWQHPFPQGNNLNAVSVNGNKVIAVGDGGTIIISSDNGDNWSVNNDIFEMKKDLSSVFFINDITGWTCGGRTSLYSPYLSGQSKILKTTNYGQNWSEQFSSLTSDFNSIYFINQFTGWCVGSSILKTTTGGDNWFPITNPSIYPYYSIYFVDSQTGWIAGWHYQSFFSLEQVYKTTDGGSSWNQEYYQEGGGLVIKLNDISFVNSQTGWIAGNDKILKTSNGGANWVQINEYGNSIFFINNSTGWILSNIIKKTTNSGNNWIFQDSIQGNCVRFTDANTGYIVSGSGKIIKTFNGGNNWNNSSYQQANNRFDIFFPSINTGFSVGDNGKILKTTNGGRQWILNISPTSSYLTSIFFINETTGWIGSSYGTTAIYKTTNSGISWFSQFNVNPSITVNSITFLNENVGFASGPPSKILKTTNSGSNWIIQDIGLNQIQKIFSLNDTTIFAVSTNGPLSIMKTTNSGNNWFFNNINGSDGLYGIDFINTYTGFACGFSGKVFKTTDAGNNWTLQSYRLGNTSLLSIKFLNSSKGASTNLGGLIFYTLDGGFSWDSLLIYSGQLNSIFSLNDSLAWIAGFNGTILCTYDFGHEFLGVQRINEIIPIYFSLHQNYPNPFNPSTKIKFELPAVGNGRDRSVRIIIYDVLGRQVATLVNEQLKPGSYEVEWVGSNFASGIYFYSLNTKDFNQTKKMLLIK